ncbi:hypothetical protein JVU11DRAFT_6606 [Chiua virens]|nr:hypothetical protein JVU11DRAFT_6606 [Chiua virens]
MSVPPVFLSHLLIRKSVAFAGNTLLLYDYFLTLPLEVSYIWKSPWSLVKVLFLVNRYGNLVGQTVVMLEETGFLSHGLQQFCGAFQLYSAILAILSGESIRFLVVLRACAILRIKRSIAVLLNALYVIYGIGMLVMANYLKKNIHPLPFMYLNETGICYSPIPPNSWITMAIVLILDTFIFSIVCFRLSKMLWDSRRAPPSQLIRLLARDALLFYIAAVFNAVFTIVCWTVYSQDPRSFIQDSVTNPFLSVVGQRLVLNLRRLGARPYSIQDFSFSRDVNRHMSVTVDRQVWCQSDHADKETTNPTMNHPVDHNYETEWVDGLDEEAYELCVLPQDLHLENAGQVVDGT